MIDSGAICVSLQLYIAKRITHPFVFGLLALAFCLAAVTPPAWAHHVARWQGGGLSMPSLVHGQMEVYARHWSEIMRLAARNVSADESFRRIENFARIERAACFWGFMPRAITDEDSPFNECSHAYLSAGKVLLDKLREQAQPGSDVSRLGEAIDRELMAAGVLAVCRFSNGNFNTADHVGPRWGEVPNHTPTLAVLVGSALLIFIIPAALWSLPLARAPRRRLGKESR